MTIQQVAKNWSFIFVQDVCTVSFTYKAGLPFPNTWNQTHKTPQSTTPCDLPLYSHQGTLKNWRNMGILPLFHQGTLQNSMKNMGTLPIFLLILPKMALRRSTAEPTQIRLPLPRSSILIRPPLETMGLCPCLGGQAAISQLQGMFIILGLITIILAPRPLEMSKLATTLRRNRAYPKSLLLCKAMSVLFVLCFCNMICAIQHL